MSTAEQSIGLLWKLWRHRWSLLAAILAAGTVTWQGIRTLSGPTVVVDQAERGDIVQTVVASGHVETPFRVEIGSQIVATVEDVLVQEGQHVVQGQPLISLESRELKGAVVQAQGAVAQAEARTRQITELTLPTAREALSQARANLLNFERAFERTAELARNGYATTAALDEARKNLDVVRTQVRTAELQVYTASPGGSDFVVAETQLNQARANLDTMTSRFAYATIAAPRDGILIARNVERGSVVQAGRALLVLAPAGEAQLVLQIDERNIGMIAVGQHATASADAYPDRRFETVISYINPGIDISRGSVEVKLTVTDAPAYLRQDMTVSVDIEVARHTQAVVLPARSVHDTLSNDPWGVGVRDGRAYRQPVRIGLRGGSNVEILEGFAVGDFAVPAASGVLTGQRIRPIRP